METIPETRPPFPCLTGASNTSESYKIDKNKYPNIVAAGIDTLELNFGIAEYKQPDMFMKLNDAKSEAVSAGYKGRLGKAVELFGQEFMAQAHGSSGGYEYLLKNSDIDLQMMPDARGGLTTPELRVVFRSPYLWRAGEIPAYNQVIGFLNKLAFIEYCKVSRADLCVDRVMPLPEIDRSAQVVSLLRERDLYYGGDYQRGQRHTGYQFGRCNTVCRLYDKAYETSVKRQGHIMPIWMANGWDGVTPVSRLEYQLRRDGLRRFDPNMDFVTFQDSKSDMWAYGTGKLIRIVDSNSATRKERAKVIPYWKDYQDCAGLFGERIGILPYRQSNHDWQPLVKQAAGCIANAWARLAADVGEADATRILEKEWEHRIPHKVIEAGLLRKARFGHMS